MSAQAAPARQVGYRLPTSRDRLFAVRASHARATREPRTTGNPPSNNATGYRLSGCHPSRAHVCARVTRARECVTTGQPVTRDHRISATADRAER